MLKGLIRAAAASLVAIALSVPAYAANIVETASQAGQFRTLLAAAQAAGLADSLATTAPLTVFAPTDAAFAKLPPGTVETLLRPENKDKLRGILAYHVVPAEVPAAAVPTKPTRVGTLNPDYKLHVRRRKGRVHVNGARVIKADIQADNGIIHVIDRVLIPGTRSAGDPFGREAAQPGPAFPMRTASVGPGVSPCLASGLGGTREMTSSENLDAQQRRAVLAAHLARVAAGEGAAMAEVYAMTSGKLNALLVRMTGDTATAEELLQDVYLSVWSRAVTFDPTRASPITWLTAIARNRAIDHLRSRGARATLSGLDAAADVPDPAPSVVDAHLEVENRHRLFACLATLDARQQAAIRSAFFDGLTYEMLAAQAGVPLGTMKSWIRRGLLRLGACLREEPRPPGSGA